jgi:hypothetical protein
VTCQQRMLIPLRHLILSFVFPGVRVSLIFTRLFYVPDLRIDFIFGCFRFSVYMAGLTNFDCGLFHSPNLDTPKLITDIWIWNGAHCGCDRSAEDAHSSAAPDPTFEFVGGSCCPTLDFVIALWIMITFYTLLSLLFVFRMF